MLATAAALLLAACAPFNHTGPDSPVARSALLPLEPRPRVALVLGSGGPRGYAHIGVMRVLEEAGIEVDLVVGTSVGSLLGAFWADGRSAKEIDRLSREGGPLTLFDPTPFADRGWIRGQRLQDYVDSRLQHRRIEQMPRRLVVGATRRGDKAPVFFTSGHAGVAVRASSAVPGILSPVGIEGVEYEDGDESLPLAVRAARQAGARFVIAVDVTPRPDSAPPGTPETQLERVARRAARIEPEAAQADHLINAGLAFGASPLPSYFRYARAQGERAARAQLPELLAQLERAGLRPAPAPTPTPAAQRACAGRYISTMSYCSGFMPASALSEIGLPMNSLRPARCTLSSSSSISTTAALAMTRNSFGLNCRASRRISRRMS